MSEFFGAAAQYDDWKGNVAADGNDTEDIRAYIESKGLSTPEEFLVGLDFFVGDDNFCSVSAFFVQAVGVDEANSILNSTQVPKVRKASIEGISAEEFLQLFKRFSVSMSWHGLIEIGREMNTD